MQASYGEGCALHPLAAPLPPMAMMTEGFTLSYKPFKERGVTVASFLIAAIDNGRMNKVNVPGEAKANSSAT